MNPISLVVSSVFLFFSARHSYLWWFKAANYVQWNRWKRNEFRSEFWFMPQTITYNFYDDHPSIEVLLNRLAGLFFMIIGIVGIIVSIRGPFGPGN